MKNQESMFAVITGASQGLGKAFATELARQGKNLILVSLPDQNLQQLSEELAEQYQVKAVCYQTDLTNDKNVRLLALWINNNFDVNLLINNAGIGGTHKFRDVGVGYINNIIQVNVMATAVLTHQLLPNLMRQNQSYILNVSSLAAFSPVGNKTVYPATKAFVHSFTRGLYAELKNTNVFVSVVNPGAMDTNDEIRARIKAQGILGKFSLSKPEVVAKKAISQLFRKDTVIIINPLSWLVLNLVPVWIKLPLMTRAVERELRCVHA
ncbi:MAG TPA: SDR family NAD(P)-dependent oxidoreductase [Bacteroidales bacterium]|nr:SDR family NAD(P)-dependent oxidoreductase [Bacteroidales bacterium]